MSSTSAANLKIAQPSDRNPLNFIERDFVIATVVEFGCSGRFMVRDLLRHFQLAAVLQIGRDTGRAEGMIANPRFDARRFGAPADDAVSVLLEEGIGCELAGLSASAAEEITVNVAANASRFDIVVQILIKTMVTGDVVLLAAFFVQTHPPAAPLDKIVANLHLNDGADPGETVDHDADQGAVAQAEEIRPAGRLRIIGGFLGNRDALEERMGLFGCQDWRLAFLERIARATDRMGRIRFDDVAGDQPIEEHA